MLWLINQATAGEMSLSGSKAPSPRPAEEKKKPSGPPGGGFNDFKIDANA
jgi:hypothetical protein